MSDRMNHLPNTTTAPQSSAPSSLPSAELCSGAELARQYAAEQKPFSAKPYLIGGTIAALVAVLVIQQFQINSLSNDLALVSDNLKSSDVRNRLDATDTQIRELNARLSYLDSKINAVDQKAQTSLAKWQEQEENDFFGNMLKNIKQTLGIK